VEALDEIVDVEGAPPGDIAQQASRRSSGPGESVVDGLREGDDAGCRIGARLFGSRCHR
jgi:hypothetical protein